MSPYAIIVILLIIIVWLIYLDKDLQTKMTGYSTSAKKMVGMSAPAGAATTTATTATPAVTTPSPPPPEKKEGFCPKLMQKYGFCDAGEGMNSRRGTFYDQTPTAALPLRGLKYEGFNTRPGVASNTQWDGYMRASTLPGI